MSSPKYKVKYLEADLYKYYEHTFIFRYIDFYVTNEYVGPRQLKLHIQLLNSNLNVCTDSLQILVTHTKNVDEPDSQIISIDPFYENHKEILVNVDYDIEPDHENPFVLLNLHPVEWWTYRCKKIHKISRKHFNKMFETDIVILPKTLFAIGIRRDYNVTHHTNRGTSEPVNVYMYRSEEHTSELQSH